MKVRAWGEPGWGYPSRPALLPSYIWSTKVNADKMLEVVRQYRALLLHIPPEAGPFDAQPSPRAAFAHIHGMLDSIEGFVKEGTKEAWDKANRWLGFIQGVFWMHGTFTLNQMRDHNRMTQ